MTTFASGGDNRIKFTKTINLAGMASVTLDITGGPAAAFQVAIFDANDQLLNGVGFGNFGSVLTTEKGGHASWVFTVPQNASYMKWGVQAYLSAAALTSYTADVNVCDPNGNALATGSFTASIPANAFQDDIVYDGVNLAQVAAAPVPPGTPAPAAAGPGTAGGV
jgi:hypothetical protein